MNGTKQRARGLVHVACALVVVCGCAGKSRDPARWNIAAPVPTDPPQPVALEGTPFSLTISGGISLGSYEAGMNWVFIEWL
ncbi:MAG TPA: hypothetical protein VMZ28_03780, partial [Kofleriaceae bacterium]|nr:hypothetical protein [Kofleriaceae bacterium]